jgi:parallel beta-helix repeat protein
LGLIDAFLTDINVCDLTVIGAGHTLRSTCATQRGMFLRYNSRIKVENCYIFETPSTGITCDQAADALVANNYIENTGYNGIGTGEQLCERVFITNNWIRGAVDYCGIEVNGHQKSTVVMGNTCEANQYGIRVFKGSEGYVPNHVQLIGNVCRLNTVMGIITIEAKGIGLHNNIVSDNPGAAVSGIKIDVSTGCSLTGNVVHTNGEAGIMLARSTDNLVNGNICYNNGQDSSVGDGIKLVDQTGAYCLRNIINANRCFDDQETKTQRYGINTTGNSNYQTIVGNDTTGNKNGGLVTVGADNVVDHNSGAA